MCATFGLHWLRQTFFYTAPCLRSSKTVATQSSLLARAVSSDQKATLPLIYLDLLNIFICHLPASCKLHRTSSTMCLLATYRLAHVCHASLSAIKNIIEAGNE